MKKYAVITGASSGIGREFAKLLADDGYSLVLIARREDRLRQLEAEVDVPCEVILADLSKEEQCEKAFEKIKDKNIEVFINNAGYGDCGEFIHGDLNKELDMIRVNVNAVHLFTKRMLRVMQERNHGYILNVASSAGLIPAGPYMATYYATKAYVVSLTRAIAEELDQAESQVYVGCLCPGPVNTEFNDVAKVKFALKGISAEFCASYGLQKMFDRKVVIIPTFLMRAAMTLGRLLPSSLYIKIAAYQQKKKID